jgi:hypothetical protein
MPNGAYLEDGLSKLVGAQNGNYKAQKQCAGHKCGEHNDQKFYNVLVVHCPLNRSFLQNFDYLLKRHCSAGLEEGVMYEE